MAALNNSLGLVFKCPKALLYPKSPWYFKEINHSLWASNNRTADRTYLRKHKSYLLTLQKGRAQFSLHLVKDLLSISFSHRHVSDSNDRTSQHSSALPAGVICEALLQRLRQLLVFFLPFNFVQFLLHWAFLFSPHYWELYRHRRTMQNAEATMWLGIKEADCDGLRTCL